MARDDSKLAFSSAFRYQRIHMKGTVNVTTASSFTTSVNVDHDLGYVPFVRLYVNYPDLTGLRRAELFAYDTEYIVTHEITSTQLKLGITNDFDFADTTVVPFYYRIYAEPQS